MGSQLLKRQLLVGGALVLLGSSGLSTPVSKARAEDEQVVHRLSKFGKLSNADTRRVVEAVSSRMKRAADMASANDPLRMAVSGALVGTPVPADAMAAAKVRLRLYAGLNQWALDNLFAPKPGAMLTCTGQFGLAQRDCQALLAAAGSVSLADAARQGGGAPQAGAGGGSFGQTAAGGGYGQPAVAYRPPQAAYGQPAAGYGPPPGSYRPPQAGYGQPPAGYGQPVAYGQPQQPGFGQPAPRYNPAYPAQPMGYGTQPMRPAAPQAAWAAPASRPMPMAQPVPMAAPPPNPAVVANRKAEYERQRQSYLERKRQEMESRKAKIMSATDGAERVQRGPSSADEAAVAGLPPDAAAKAQPAAGLAKAPAKGAAPSKAAPGKPTAVAAAEPSAAQEPAAPAAPKASAKATLDNDFLSGLMDDPLGKK